MTDEADSPLPFIVHYWYVISHLYVQQNMFYILGEYELKTESLLITELQ